MSQGVQKFVLRQNNIPQVDGVDDGKRTGTKKTSVKVEDGTLPTAEDLKVPVPKGSKSGKMKNFDQIKRTTRSQSQQPDHRNGMFGTDASNADLTSTNGSGVGRRKSGQPSEQKPVSQDQHYDFHTGGEVNFDDGDENIDHHEGLPHMDGDTYPETTDGQPSVQDPNENHAPYPASQSRIQQPPAGFTRGRRGIPTHAGQQHGSAFQQPGPAQHSTHPHQLMPPPQAHDIIDGLQDGFTFGAAPQTQLNMHRSNPHQQAPKAPPQQKSQPQPRPASPAMPRSDQAMQAQQHMQHAHELRKQAAESHHREQRLADGRPASRDPRGYEPSRRPKEDHRRVTHEPAPPTEPPSEVDQDVDDGNGEVEVMEHRANQRMVIEEDHEEQQDEEDSALDFPQEELFGMDFANLKAQSFDDEPKAVEFKFEGDLQNKSVEDKMAALVGMTQHNQADFLHSLNLDQWEEAGDWMVGQFTNIISRFKDARKEKRKAAQEFEDEIGGRHEAVSKKQKLTQTALSEMKESGGKVLQGTPQKKGRKRK